jgi:hypothetical protein
MFIICAGCFYAPQGSVAGRWDVDAVDMPDVAGFIDSIKSDNENAKESMEDFFRGDELVLRKDHTCDIALFKQYIHGTWKFEEGTNTLSITDEAGFVQPVVFRVNKVDGQHMVLTTDNVNVGKLVPLFQTTLPGYSYFKTKKRFTFFLSVNSDNYWQSKNDPYSKQNNLWRIKPHNPETDGQIAERVNRHLQFCRLVVQDAIDNNKGYVSFNWFVTPLMLASTGGGLQGYERTKEKWEANFYNPEQALKGYKLLEQSLEKSRYEPDATRTRFENYIMILDGVIANLPK